MPEIKRNKLYIDWYLIVAMFAMTLFGLIMIYSASFVQGYEEFNNPNFYLRRQLQWVFISTIVFCFLVFFPYRHLKKLIPAILIVCFLLLFSVMIPQLNVTVGGATRWIEIAGFRLQPSEFVKIGAIIYISYVYSRKMSYINQFWKGLFPPLFIVAIFFALILTQPDLGTGTSIIIVAVLIAFCSGARFTHLIGMGAIAASAFIWYVRSEEYRMNRILGFQTPFELEQTQGFHLIQSYIAIAHGGLTGVGLGQGVQKLFYLPEAHTDFILAVVSEELGVLGILFAIVSVGFIIFRGILIGSRCQDTFGKLLAFGLVFQLAIQMIFNGGAVSGLLPITGITFPFLSYGGSSLLVTYISLGILVNISRKTEKERSELSSTEAMTQ